MTRYASLAALVVVLALVAGCGSNNEKTTTANAAQSEETWANGVCNAFLTWEMSLSSIGQKLKGTTLSSASLRQAAGDAETATTTLQMTLSSLGKPPTPTAQQAKTIVTQLSTELKSAASTAKNALSNASGPGGRAQAASVAAQQIAKMSNDLSAAVTKLQSLNGDTSWQKAFSSAESCQALKKNG